MAYFFRGDSTSKPGIYLRTVDRTSAPQLVLAGPNLVPNSFTPDGASIAFSLGALNLGSLNTFGSQYVASDIGIVTIGDTTVRWILRTEFNDRQAQISKDGRTLAYTSDRSGSFEVYVQTMSGDAVPVPVSTRGATSPRWGRDGRLLYIDLVGHVYAASIAAGTGTVVTKRELVSRGASSADLNYSNVNWDLFPAGRMLIIDRYGPQRRRIALVQNWPAFVRQLGARQ
jgi:Tol biopolymer transport system component